MSGRLLPIVSLWSHPAAMIRSCGRAVNGAWSVGSAVRCRSLLDLMERGGLDPHREPRGSIEPKSGGG
jgi:hypothetical protein